MGKIETFDAEIDEYLIDLCLESWNDQMDKLLYFNTKTLKFSISDNTKEDENWIYVARREFKDLHSMDFQIVKDEVGDYYFTGSAIESNTWCFCNYEDEDDSTNGLINEPAELYEHYIRGDIEYNDLFKKEKDNTRELLKYSPVINA